MGTGRLLRRLLYPRWLRSGRVALGLLVVVAMLALALLAPALAPHDPAAQDLTLTLQPVRLGSAFPLGTDGLGRCVLSRLLHGARLALWVAVAAAFGAMLLGSALAYAGGYLGGRTDWLIGRTVDAWTLFPPVVLALILLVGLGAGSTHLVLAIILAEWPRVCRVLCCEVRKGMRRDHVAAARLLGFPHWRTLLLEVVPATVPRLLTLLALEMGSAVVMAAILGVIGLGVTPDQAAWGQMIADGRAVIHQAPANLLAPAAAIVITVAGFNLLGEGLRRTLEPRPVGGRQ
ncbi:MAG: ABC transporter permease [Acetobacteraceae bacterium]|nr:ABC transporter permease [Acetobacteraceae bacterium]